MSFKLAISSYSFQRFGMGPEGAERPSCAAMIERCAELGFAGIELLAGHVDSTTPEDLYALKRHAARHGVAIVALAANHNFVNPDGGLRLGEIDKVAHWVDVAYRLGTPVVRVVGGRWNTQPDFAAYLAAKAGEPPLPGYTDDQGYAWNADAFRIAAYYAGRHGITLGVENHWGLTATAAGVLRILEETASPWLQAIIDTGNFVHRPDPYADMAALAPHAILVHAKTYLGGGLFYTADLDYRRIGRILREAGFQGYVSLEFEGAAHPDQGIDHGVALLREAFAAP